MRVGAYLLVVDRENFSLEVWKRRATPPRQYRLVDTHEIAVGMIGFDTRAGVYWVQARAKNPEWRMPDSSWVDPADRGKVIPGGHPQNPIKAAFLKLTDDGIGIHGTDKVDSLKQRVSHGCIRVRPAVALDLHDHIRKGTPVVIL